ncbi:MAG: cell envelope biogenesis protein TolA [Rhizobiales bacterium]|nr:cell envelope biogenesis protein TolA [Hyphomicrobiales bacterium]
MARQLKTYITNLGFFELAIAAPSMKAALEAWGMSHNAFQHGFAKITDEPAIVAATSAKPGVVLKRAVGTTGPFKEDAALPDALPNIRPPANIGPPAPKAPARPRPKESSQKTPRPDPAAVISFEKVRRERERERAKQAARLEKQKAERDCATGKAQAALEDAQQAHQKAMDTIAREQEKLDRRSENETARWEVQRKKLAAAVDRARD